MSRSILFAATVAAATLVPLVPAIAQQSDGIVVNAPAPRNADESKLGAQPRMRLAANVIVETGDLDLRTAYGRDVLDRRVRVAADQACDQLDDIEPPTGVGAAMNPDSGDCRHLAVKSAEPRIRYAVLASR